MTTLSMPRLAPAKWTGPLPQVRSDTLPENTPYRDDGCEVSPSCLACPLPICKFDDPGWLQRENRRGRDSEVLRLRASDVPVDLIARRYGVSARTVHRIVQRGSRAPASPIDDDQGPLMTLQELARRSLFRARTPWPGLMQARHHQGDTSHRADTAA